MGRWVGWGVGWLGLAVLILMRSRAVPSGHFSGVTITLCPFTGATLIILLLTFVLSRARWYVRVSRYCVWKSLWKTVRITTYHNNRYIYSANTIANVAARNRSIPIQQTFEAYMNSHEIPYAGSGMTGGSDYFPFIEAGTYLVPHSSAGAWGRHHRRYRRYLSECDMCVICAPFTPSQSIRKRS